jgi:hypothetical protein
MDLIRPEAIDDTTFTSSNVTEADYAVYAAGTTYATDDYVIVTTGDHTVYKSLADSNTGNTPASSPTYWEEVSATNRWKMFDAYPSTITTNTDTIEVEVTPGRINSLALLRVDAAEITVTLTDPVEGVVYTNTVDMVSDSGILDWYDYFYEPIVRRTDLVLTDIPAYNDAVLAVVLDNTGSNAECGLFVVGNKRSLGTAKWEPEISILDYSQKTTDDQGRTTLVEGRFARLLEIDLFLPTGYADELRRLLTEYRATPAVWIGSELYTSTIVYGFFRSFEIVLSTPTISDCNIEIEGLT